MRTIVTALLLLALALASPGRAQQPPPTFDFESLLDTYFDDESGLISFGDYVVAFAPEGPFHGEVVVVDSASEVVARFPFFEEARMRNGVFARVQVVGPADVTLSEPGMYNLVFQVEGQPVSRLAFVLEQTSAGDDPFDPSKTFAFDGLWRGYAHLTMTTTHDGKALPQLNLWLGGKDLPPDVNSDGFVVTLLRDGEPVAHGKPDVSIIRPGHYERMRADLFHPHEKKDAANAEPFTLDDWLVDGAHELRVTRRSDGVVLRSYDFTVDGGEIQALPQTISGYEPTIDYIMPRVVKKGSTAFEMDEAIWLYDRPEAR